jgi:alkane 1-monooxygenase
MDLLVPKSDKSPVALLRLAPLLFPFIFLCTAMNGAIATLYAAVLLHFLIIAAELTIGRIYARAPVPVFIKGSTAFEDTCLRAWAGLHVVVLGAMMYFVESTELTGRQIFAVGALFGYSINTFSAAVAHELLHRGQAAQRFVAQLLYAMMLYPHFPSVHLASHHRWAGTDRDCQTPGPRQSVHAYLVQALVGGIRTIRASQARAPDWLLRFPVLMSLLLLAGPLALNMPAVSLFVITQGLFSFLLIETINFVQHYEPLPREDDPDANVSRHANQDLNFVSRCLLFNLPLHAAHHDRPELSCSELSAIPAARTSLLGYWCSFWLAWLPPLWHSLHCNRSLNRD